MKRLLLYAIAATMALPSLAELNGNGYYRVQNAYTKRYAYLLDNRGSYNATASTADVAALELYLDKDRMISDPATVFYIESAPQGNNFYDIAGQGTSIHTFMDEYLSIVPTSKPYDDIPSYYIYATKSGMSKYLGDRRSDQTVDKGLASVDCNGDNRKWYFNPIAADSEMYFGVLPTVKAEGKEYATMYADFAFDTYSEGMKVYAITDIDVRGGAIITEIMGGVPSGTPVIIECAGAEPSDNRLNIGGPADPVSNNKLQGVYFDNDTELHYNRTAFNKETMRVLGVGKDGRLAFVRGSYQFIPRNIAYLQLTDPAQYGVDEFLVLTEEQREEELNAVAVIPVSAAVDVYSLDGRLVKSGMTKENVPSLGNGLYILRSAGLSEKMIVH